ncbi:n-acetylglutamate synthase [Hymenobacter metallilatus]|uniref:N-acetylglutamate synthase n=1 Tax=Hymenobacter metallilatus TaxID=2493666 RepID=A0A428JR84_9BACT|nr:n-acetylglutamate synthase [Hymenobacter metallilatus]RSK36027.1 n-acetylglutamate synthase [Hymenobacter metallilatus]
MPAINYHNRVFRSVDSTPNGEVDAETSFYYQQEGNLVTATYSGGDIRWGMLLALADAAGNLTMRYQHLNQQHEFRTGICLTTPEVLSDGRLRLHERWQWTSGDQSAGHSVLEEVLT